MDKTIYLLITLLMYVFSSYIVFWYGHRLFEFKKDAKTSFTICLATNILLWILLVSFSTFIINIPATIILFFIIFYFAFNCDLKLSIFNSLLLVAIMNISEYIVLFLVSSLLNLELNHYENNLITFAEEAFASKILYFGLLAIISSFSKYISFFVCSFIFVSSIFLDCFFKSLLVSSFLYLFLLY